MLCMFTYSFRVVSICMLSSSLISWGSCNPSWDGFVSFIGPHDLSLRSILYSGWLCSRSAFCHPHFPPLLFFLTIHTYYGHLSFMFRNSTNKLLGWMKDDSTNIVANCCTSNHCLKCIILVLIVEEGSVLKRLEANCKRWNCINTIVETPQCYMVYRCFLTFARLLTI